MQILDGRLVLSPSDLNNFIECEHLTTLQLEVARNQRTRPHVPDEHGELIRSKGQQHETAYLIQLRAEGREVVDVTDASSWEAAARRTEAAMRAGAEMIYQATFVLGDWRGRADFLERVDRETRLGAWGYEAVDAKLARVEKPTYILQLCFYSEGIARVQGMSPEWMHVLLGHGERRPLRHADFAAHFRRVRRGFEARVRAARATEPYRVDHCALCDFRDVCRQRWEQEDHLVLVAGMRREQSLRLRDAGISTLAALATVATTQVPRMQPHTFENLRDQAYLQLSRRATGRTDWHALPSEPGCGFALLPRPSPGDLVFDIEGDPFWEPARGLHFLFGLLAVEGARYRSIWAHDRAGEQHAFEEVVDLIHAQLARHPDMHVYHYGTYEQTALKQLMGVYATREAAIDDLLRRRIFVNLHEVVRQGLRAGVPSYSLKEIEALFGFARAAQVRSGTRAILDYESWITDRDETWLSRIAAYNAEDCDATRALRDWLLRHRPEDLAWPEPRMAKETAEDDGERSGAREALRRELVDASAPRSPKWLAGELLEYHQREARPGWWWFFARQDHMSPQELLEDSEAIGMLQPIGPVAQTGKSAIHTFTFPPQQHKLGSGDTPFDPATKKAAGTIVSVDDGAGTVALKRGPTLAAVPLPAALIPGKPIPTDAQRAALMRLATSVRDDDGRYPALRDILARARPRFAGGPRGTLQTMDMTGLRELAASLDGSYLFVQGPPGTGKTWTGARLVVELMRRGRRVGVAATSHKAIHKLLADIETAAKEERFTFTGLKKANTGNAETEYAGAFIASSSDLGDFTDPDPEILLFAGTAWLFARVELDAFAAGESAIDTLAIDEAGQVSLGDALAMGTAARNLILLGDPQQLAQVSQGTHPDGTGVSVLEHLLGDQATVPPDLGVFLERTRRMHPRICDFVSEVVYEKRLTWEAEVERQDTAFGTGLRFLPVQHEGNAAASSEEADVVVGEVQRMLGAPWTDSDGAARRLTQGRFMVVAPYNAQVRRLREALRRANLPDVPVGTVDKFQGQEAAVVFYSMATSSPDDVPRNLEFLFSRNRFNVAISRAKCLAVVVASPRLLESRARTVDQMRLINALCRFAEMADAQAGVVPGA